MNNDWAKAAVKVLKRRGVAAKEIGEVYFNPLVFINPRCEWRGGDYAFVDEALMSYLNSSSGYFNIIGFYPRIESFLIRRVSDE